MDSVKGGQKLTLEDGAGGKAELYCFEDLVLPVGYPDWFELREKLESIRQFKYRKGDVLVCSYPKSGNHWLTNLLTLVLSSNPVETATSVNVNLIEVARPTERLNKKPSPRIITSHLKYNRLPTEHFRNGGKVILLLRNPKDVAVSYFYHGQKDKTMEFTLSWNHYLKCFFEGKVLFGSYFDYLNDWQNVLQNTKDLNVLIVYYENLKQQPLSELQKIQTFLGVYNSEDRLKKIIAKCSLFSLKSDVDSGKINTMLRDRNNRPFIFRKGEVGDWKNHFSIAQNEAFEKVIHSKLHDSIFRFQYTCGIPTHRL